MSDTTFSEIGKIQAINALYADSSFKPFGEKKVKAEAGDYIRMASSLFTEGIDFDLVYFPLKHLGYKCVLQVTGELYASLSHPRILNVELGVSSKLDFPQVRELWSGVVSAAREFGYKDVNLDLVPSCNGLIIQVAAFGISSQLTEKRRSKAQSKDLICVSGSLGAAFLGQRILERGKQAFESGANPDLEQYKMLVGAYLKPELSANLINAMEESEIYPSYGYFITHGLADAVKRLGRDSGFGAKVYADKIPFEGNSFQLGREMNIDPVSAAMNGGDDCKLLFVVPILKLEKFRRDFQTFDIIGHLALPEAGTVLVTPEGVELPLSAQGWNDED